MYTEIGLLTFPGISPASGEPGGDAFVLLGKVADTCPGHLPIYDNS